METAETRITRHQFCVTLSDQATPVEDAQFCYPLDPHTQLTGYASGPMRVNDTPSSLLMIFGYWYASPTEETLAHLANALERDEHDAPAQYDGLFAVLFYHRATQTLSLYSDRVGNYRLFYHQQAQQLHISSDVRLFTSAPSRLDSVWLNQMLHYRIAPSTHSFDESIHTLPAGHYAQFNARDAAPSIHTYWMIPPRRPQAGSTLAQRCEQTEHALLNAMSAAGVAHKKTAVLLSGGVDSALLLALAKQLNPDVLAITPEFVRGSNPELETAKQLAQQAEVTHRCVQIDDAEITESLAHVLAVLSQPPRSHSTLALDQLFKQLSPEYELVLYGETADTLFGSKQVFNTLRQIRHAKHPSLKAKLLQLAAKLTKAPALEARTAHLERDILQHIQSAWHLDFSPHTQRTLPGQSSIAAQMDVTGDLLAATRHKTTLDEPTLAELTRHFLVTVDVYNHFYCVGSLARDWGLELVSPFIFSQVYTLANQLSDEHYHNQHTAKPVLKELACRYYTNELVYQPKRGFPVPYEHWLQGPLKAHADNAKAFIRRHFSAQLAADNELVWTMVCLTTLLSEQQLAQTLEKLADR